VLALAAAVTALLAATRAWRTAGFTTGVHEPGLLWLPAAVALVPLVGGMQLPGAGLLAVLVAGYAATGFVEEALFRGLILGVLRPVGVWPAVLLSSALFAAAHLPNMLSWAHWTTMVGGDTLLLVYGLLLLRGAGRTAFPVGGGHPAAVPAQSVDA
jgi:membrane protease YdiL (CAAX protease family)